MRLIEPSAGHTGWVAAVPPPVYSPSAKDGRATRDRAMTSASTRANACFNFLHILVPPIAFICAVRIIFRP